MELIRRCHCIQLKKQARLPSTSTPSTLLTTTRCSQTTLPSSLCPRSRNNHLPHSHQPGRRRPTSRTNPAVNVYKVVSICLRLGAAGWIWSIVFIICSPLAGCSLDQFRNLMWLWTIWSNRERRKIRFLPWNPLQIVLMFRYNSFPSIEFVWMCLCNTQRAPTRCWAAWSILFYFRFPCIQSLICSLNDFLLIFRLMCA